MVFNHPSWVDSILLQYLFAPSGVSREANLRYPIVGRIIFAFQNIYVPFRTASEQTDSAQQPLAQRTTTQLIADRCAFFRGRRRGCAHAQHRIQWRSPSSIPLFLRLAGNRSVTAQLQRDKLAGSRIRGGP